MFLRFIMCSGFAALINISAGQLLYGVLGFDGAIGYPVSVAMAFVAGMGVSYMLNRRITYPPSGRHIPAELVRFLAVSAGGLALTTLLAQALVLVLRQDAGVAQRVAPESAAHVLAVGITAIYSFLAHRFISFGPVKKHSDLSADAGLKDV